jgi:hypothetical protein
MLDEPRTKIVKTFAGWTALSALRSGSPVKSRKLIYSLLRCVRFAELFSPADTRMLERDFGRWHREAVESLAAREPSLAVGWAAKIVNVYLNTAVYVGGLGRPGRGTASTLPTPPCVMQ